MKRFFKIISIILILLLFGGYAFLEYWRSAKTIETFYSFFEPPQIDYHPMIWHSDYIGNQIIEKAGLFVKVEILGIHKDFFMQLDTGTPTTILYENTIKKIVNQYPLLKIEKSKNNSEIIKNISFIFNKTKLIAKQIEIYPNKGSSNIDSSFTVIGTLGFDALVNRTLLLDYKNNKWAITKKSIQQINPNIQLVKDASVNKFPLLIPAKIDAKKVRFFFDTGSSMFSILTSIKNLNALQSNAKIDTLCCVRQWTRQLKLYRKQVHNHIEIGAINTNSKYVYALENMNIINYFPNRFLYGITGNKLFDKKVIIIDNKHNLFGIDN
jgi:hypothetical protein